MTESMSVSGDVLADLRLAFYLLGSAELGQSITWAGPTDAVQLRVRVSTLAILHGVIPWEYISRIDDVAAHWATHFQNDNPRSIAELRQSAREFLTASTKDGHISEAKKQMSKIERWLGVTQAAVAPSTSFSKETRNSVALALFTWQTKLTDSPEWTMIPGMIPGDPSVPLKDVYIELFACPWEEGIKNGWQSTSQRQREARVNSQKRPAVSVADMVSRTLDSCVVLGDPGAGKSTVINWLAWATRHEMLADFDLAIVVKLRVYSAAVEEAPELGLLEFFLESQVPRIRDWHEAADCLRATAKASSRFLLLLDGWDEVPSHLREQVKNHILRDGDGFVCVVTSRMSGLPWQIYAPGRSQFYEIAGLGPQAIREFVHKRIESFGGSLEAAENVTREIESDSDLAIIATNPFLLSLIVRALSLPSDSTQSMTRANIYQEIVSWIVEQIGQAQSQPFEQRHLWALEDLAYKLSVTERTPRYVFRENELHPDGGGLAQGPLARSRFVLRIDETLSHWSMVHATIQEFLAARGLARQTTQVLEEHWDQLLLSHSRMVVLEFFGGLDRRTQRFSMDRSSHWLAKLDRFGLLTVRVAQAASAGKWKQVSPEQYDTVLDALWHQLLAAQDGALLRLFVSVFAAIDADELCRRVLQRPGISLQMQELLCDFVSPKQLNNTGVYEKLRPQLRQHLAVRQLEPLERLTDPTQPAAEHVSESEAERFENTLAIALASLRSIEVAATPEVREALTLHVASIFTQLPDVNIVEVLTDIPDMPIELLRMASATMSYSRDGGQRINPRWRDRLLSRLAVLPEEDPRVEHILEALISYPIREGGELIAGIAMNQFAPQLVRVTACSVLQTVADDKVVRNVVESVTEETHIGIVDFLVDLAVARNAVLPVEWLEKRITAYFECYGPNYGRIYDRFVTVEI